MRAVEIMLVVPKSADDMMNVGRLNGFPGKLTAQGKLIKQGILLFCDITPLLSNLDNSSASEILAQFETKKNNRNKQFNNKNINNSSSSGFISTATSNSNQQQQSIQMNPNSTSQFETGQQSDLSTSGSNTSSNSLVGSYNKQILSTSLIGTAQMSDQSRIVLNHLLSNSSQVKLRERQTFLFEQTIIFSEVNRKSSSSSSSSSSYSYPSASSVAAAAAAASVAAQTYCSNNINPTVGVTSSSSASSPAATSAHNSSSNPANHPFAHSGNVIGQHNQGSKKGQSNYLASSQANSSNYHPCYPHSHNQFTGAVENCCYQQDCTLPQSGNSNCSRLLNLNQQQQNQAASKCSPESGRGIGAVSQKASSSTNAFTSSFIKRRDSNIFHSASAVFQSSFHSNSSNLLNQHQQHQTNHVSSSNITDSSNSQTQQNTLTTNNSPSLNTNNNPNPSRYNHHHHHSANLNQSSIPHYYSMPSYEYKNHLSINKVALIDKHYGVNFGLNQLFELFGDSFDMDVESRRFMLKSRDPNQENVIYLLQTGCSYDRDEWVCSIRSMLECQLDFLRALQSPIAYQRGLTKEG